MVQKNVTGNLTEMSEAAPATTTVTLTATAAPSGGKDSGTTIGIAVGVPLGVLLLLALSGVAFLLRKQKNHRCRTQDQEFPLKSTYEPGVTEHIRDTSELPDNRRHFELSGNTRRL